MGRSLPQALGRDPLCFIPKYSGEQLKRRCKVYGGCRAACRPALHTRTTRSLSTSVGPGACVYMRKHSHNSTHGRAQKQTCTHTTHSHTHTHTHTNTHTQSYMCTRTLTQHTRHTHAPPPAGPGAHQQAGGVERGGEELRRRGRDVHQGGGVACVLPAMRVRAIGRAPFRVQGGVRAQRVSRAPALLNSHYILHSTLYTLHSAHRNLLPWGGAGGAAAPGGRVGAG